MKIRHIPLLIVLVVATGLPLNGVAQTLTTLYHFTGGADGGYPYGALVQGSDGNFYGTTTFGGTSEWGTVFKISPAGTMTTLYSFTGGTDGGYPMAGLVQGSDGDFYGTTQYGGIGVVDNLKNGWGTVFKISPTGNLTTLYSFTGYPDGEGPVAGLVLGFDGNFYSTTEGGGTNGHGTVYEISPTGIETVLYSFTGIGDGCCPESGLVQGSDSNFYGTAGTVFMISPTGTLTTLVPDSEAAGWSLMQGGDGNFYGITGGGETNGTLFKMSPTGTLITLYSFTGGEDGGSPVAGLAQGRDGDFYGTTRYGGTKHVDGALYEYGTLYKISPAGSLTTLHKFTGGADGATPAAAPVQGSDGNFYGTTTGDGTSGYGTVFKLAVGGSVGDCTYALSVTNVTLTAKGGSKNVTVKAKGANCEWTAVSNDPFITITSSNSGMGNGQVEYSVADNTNATPLSGTITVADQTFTVNQLAGGCRFKLSPASGKIKPAGGSATVKVTPNFTDCNWTAVSNDSFITITRSASGVGKGTVTYTVIPNTNTMAVTGTMTIAGQTYTVTEAAAK